MSRPCKESGATRPNPPCPPRAPRHVGPSPSGSRRPSPPRHPLSRRGGAPSASGSRRPSPPRRPPSRHGGAPSPSRSRRPSPPRRPPSRHDGGPSPSGFRGPPPPARGAAPPAARSAPGAGKPGKPPPPASKGPPPPATKRPPPPATKRPPPPPSTGAITKLERRRERNRLLLEAEKEKTLYPAKAADRKRILWFAGQSWHGCANCASYETLMAPEALRAWVVRAALDLGIADAKLCPPSPELPHPLLWQTPDCVDFPDFFNRVKGLAISQRLPLVEGMEWWMERAKTESEGPNAKRRREDASSATVSVSSATSTTASGSTRSAVAPATPILADSPASPELPADRGVPPPRDSPRRHSGGAQPARSSTSSSKSSLTSSSRSSLTSATCVPSADSSPSSPSPMTDMDTPLSPEPQEAPGPPPSRDTATPTTPALTTPDLPLPLTCCDEPPPSAPPPLRARLSSARSEDTWEWDPERPLVHNGCCFPGASSTGCCQADAAAGAGGLSTDTSPADPPAAAAEESRTSSTSGPGPGFEPGGDEASSAGSHVEPIPGFELGTEDDNSVTYLGDVVRGAGERTVNVVISKVEEAEGASLGFQLREMLEASSSSSSSENIYKDCDQQAQLPPDRLSKDTVAVTPMELENEPPHHHHRANGPKKRARCNDVNVLRSKLINIMRDTKLKVLPST